jgi:hypothetical protein
MTVTTRVIINVHTAEFRGDHAADTVESFTIDPHTTIEDLLMQARKANGISNSHKFHIEIPRQQALEETQIVPEPLPFN